MATPFAVHKFYKDIKSQGFKIGKDTAYQYLEYLEDAFLVFPVPIFSESERKRKQNPKKNYIIDNGLVCVNSWGPSLNWGNLFENQVFLDLKRQGKRVFYYQTKEGYEVDFVIENLDRKLELLQVVWDVSDPKTLAREKRALQQAEKELGIKGRILTFQDYMSSILLK